MDPILNYEINKFFLLFIPRFVLEGMPVFMGTLLVTLIPYTPVNLIIFTLIFLVIFMTDIFGLGSHTDCGCKFNQPETKSVFSVWTVLKSTYMIYLVIAYIVNYNTVSRYALHKIHAI